MLYMSQDHVEFCLEPEDGLHIWPSRSPTTRNLDPRAGFLL
jgi:hypothetical protein